MLKSIADHAKSHGLIPKKSLGQNFLFDLSLCEKIAGVSGLNANDTILEIGSGPGGLTRGILNHKPKKLFAIETDARCIKLLEEIGAHYPNKLQVIHRDAMKMKISDISSEPLRIIANLPYHIGTALLINWLGELDRCKSITLMLQKEVVDRICAKIDTKEYGRLSIICQALCDVKKFFDVSAKAFYPPPKIDSSIVHLVPKAILPQKSIIQALEKVTFAAFNQRRKMIRTSLKNFHIEQFGIDTSLRAENLSVEEYLRIAEHFVSSNTERLFKSE